jgi:hypothetical protein
VRSDSDLSFALGVELWGVAAMAPPRLATAPPCCALGEWEVVERCVHRRITVNGSD